MSRKNKRRNLTIVDVLLDETDRYGIKYKESLKGAFPCICCTRQMSKTTITCMKCEYEYNFCDKKCLENESVIYGMGECIFCHRRRNDAILKIVGGDKLDLIKDLYGNKAVDRCIKN